MSVPKASVSMQSLSKFDRHICGTMRHSNCVSVVRHLKS